MVVVQRNIKKRLGVFPEEETKGGVDNSGMGNPLNTPNLIYKKKVSEQNPIKRISRAK